MAKSIQSQMALGMIETRGLVASIEAADAMVKAASVTIVCLLYTSPRPRDATLSRMPSSA